MSSANQMKINSWATALMTAVTTPEELFHLLELDPTLLPQARAAGALFPLKVPREFITRMQKGNREDPLLQQVLPIAAEFNVKPGFSMDPLDEKGANPVPGLLHKYSGRVLLTLTGACGVNCRFCFRRHFPYAENNTGKSGWGRVLEYIAQDPSIREVILSGGDPLVLNDYLLEQFAGKLAQIPHLKRLRIHSRMPIVVPERITDEFLHWTAQTRLKTILVVHCNHPQEINQKVKAALMRVSASGILLLNQSVLLKGINDNVATLVSLSETLLEAGALPYYLNLLDKVQGAAHYEVALARAKSLYHELFKELPGYLVPKLVCEQPGQSFKTPVCF